MRKYFFCIIFISFFSSFAMADNFTPPAWSPSINQNQSFQVNKIAEGCGPADNEICISCHNLLESAPYPDIKRFTKNTHTNGMFKLTASQYLNIDMHTYTENLKPKCTSCHFNSKISKKELSSFKYGKFGDKICFTCHPDKSPLKDNNMSTSAASFQQENPFVKKLKGKYLNSRNNVMAYRNRLKID